MALYETIGQHLKEAMKAGDVLRRDTLRLLNSALKNTAIEKRKAPAALSNEEIETVIRRMVKQRRDSVIQFQAGHRSDLAAKEEAEAELLVAYLPQALSEEALETVIRETLSEAGLITKSQMGQAMGLSIKKVAGRASGDEVRRIVEQCLS